jgi:hypothetical protein
MAAHRPGGEGCSVLIDARMRRLIDARMGRSRRRFRKPQEDVNMKVRRWRTITALAAAASLALVIGAAPSQAATPVERTKVSAGLSVSDLAKLPLTDRHLTKHEKANLAVVLRAYHVAEVLNGIGGESGQDTLRGQQLGDLVVWMGKFLPDVHRNLKQITVRGDVVSIELSIQGTFLGPFDTPAGVIQPTEAKIDIPTADFWYLRNGKVEVFDCHIGFTAMYAQLGVLPDYASAVGG